MHDYRFGGHLIKAFAGYFLDVGDFKWEVVRRCLAARIALKFFKVTMSKKGCELLELEEVCAGRTERGHGVC